MSYLLRQIKNNTKWDKSDFPHWLKANDLPSCIVEDLTAKNNCLSLWEIDDDKSNVVKVMSALATGRPTLKLDWHYALLQKRILDQVNYNLENVEGHTAYLPVNQFHREVPNLSLNQVVYFAHLINENAYFNDVNWKEVQIELIQANKNKQLDLRLLNGDIKKQLDISD